MTLHYTTFHRSSLHYTTLHTLHYNSNYTTFHYISLPYITLHSTTTTTTQLHSTRTTLPSTTLPTLHYTTLHYIFCHLPFTNSAQLRREVHPLPSQKPQLLPGDHLPISDRKLTTMSFTTRSSVVIDLFLSRFGFLQSEYVLIKTPFWFVKSLFLMVNAPVT